MHIEVDELRTRVVGQVLEKVEIVEPGIISLIAERERFQVDECRDPLTLGDEVFSRLGAQAKMADGWRAG